MAKLAKLGFFGFRIERDKLRFEVEKEYSSASRANAEVRRITAAGVHIKVEDSPGTK